MKPMRIDTLLLLCLVTGLSACGSQQKSGDQLAESLPNQSVPVSAKVTDATFSGTQTGEENTVEALVRSNAPATFTLAQSAEALGNLPETDYLAKQVEWVGSNYPACNFFLITALCEAGYCTRSKPFYKAADFDDYFIREGWGQTDLESLRVKAIANETMDVVFQKEGVTVDQPGHVVILVGYNQNTRRFIIAEGSLGTITNVVKEVSDSFLLSWNGGFNIFIRQPAPETTTATSGIDTEEESN